MIHYHVSFAKQIGLCSPLGSKKLRRQKMNFVACLANRILWAEGQNFSQLSLAST